MAVENNPQVGTRLTERTVGAGARVTGPGRLARDRLRIVGVLHVADQQCVDLDRASAWNTIVKGASGSPRGDAFEDEIGVGQPPSGSRRLWDKMCGLVWVLFENSRAQINNETVDVAGQPTSWPAIEESP